MTTMLTRSERKKLIGQGIHSEFLTYEPQPKIKLPSGTCNFKDRSNVTPLVGRPENVKTNNVAMADKINEANDCAKNSNFVSLMDSVSTETGYSSAPESLPNELDTTKLILNSTSIQKPRTSKHSESQDELLIPTQHQIQSIATSPRLNCLFNFKIKNPIETRSSSPDKLVPILAVRPTHIIKETTSKSHVTTTHNLEKFERVLDTESDANDIYSNLFRGSSLTDWWMASFQSNQPIPYKPKVKVLEILYLPPGTIDPSCPIDIYEQPIDLRINQQSDDHTQFEPIDLSVRKEFQPTEYCKSPLLHRTQIKDSQETSINYKVQEVCHIPDFSADRDIRRRVYEILNYPCFRFLENGTCNRIQCKFQHSFVEPGDIQEILKSEPIIIIEKCYTLVNQFDSLFHKYFQIFCSVFGENHQIESLIRMISDCEQPKRPVSFYRHIITGLQLCKLDEITCFTHLIQNSALKSPKSFNILIWIMVDLGVVLEFSSQLKEFLRHDGFYISAPNLTRLLGVCSRTRNCELIRIIYEAIENYPAKIKEQLHWSVRPKYIRLENNELGNSGDTDGDLVRD